MPSQILWPFCEAMLFQNVYTPDKRINMNPTGRRFSQHVSFLRAPSDPEGCISSILFHIFQSWSQCPHFSIVVGSRVSGKGSLPSSILKCSLLLTRSRHNRHIDTWITWWHTVHISHHFTTVQRSNQGIGEIPRAIYTETLGLWHGSVSIYPSFRWSMSTVDSIDCTLPKQQHCSITKIFFSILRCTVSSCMSWYDLNSSKFMICIIYYSYLYSLHIFAVLHDNSWNLHP